jgi:MFS family permease
MDRFGFQKSAYLSLILTLLATVVNALNEGDSIVLYAIGYGIYWFSLGTWLSMMPSFIKLRYGKEAYASLYGKVFTAYGVSAIMGTLLSGVILDQLRNTAFIYYGIIIIIFTAFLEVKTIKPLRYKKTAA